MADIFAMKNNNYNRDKLQLTSLLARVYWNAGPYCKANERDSVCVCVCVRLYVCERVRERERTLKNDSLLATSHSRMFLLLFPLFVGKKLNSVMKSLAQPGKEFFTL